MTATPPVSHGPHGSHAAHRVAKAPRRTIRDAILDAARPLLAQDPSTSLERIAAEAEVSRASFYRHFHNRAELLDALDVEPDQGARERILAAALQLMAQGGFRVIQMDELAVAAGVSRASVYRLFPGKQALFRALVEAYAPFEDLDHAIHAVMDEPPERAIPHILREGARVAAPRIAVLRSLLLEITSEVPEAVAAAQLAARPFLETLTRYFAVQVERGTIRPIHPVLAAQSMVGQLVFHLLTAGIAPALTGFHVTPDEAAQVFAQVALRGLLPEPAPALTNTPAANPANPAGPQPRA